MPSKNHLVLIIFNLIYGKFNTINKIVAISNCKFYRGPDSNKHLKLKTYILRRLDPFTSGKYFTGYALVYQELQSCHMKEKLEI